MDPGHVMVSLFGGHQSHGSTMDLSLVMGLLWITMGLLWIYDVSKYRGLWSGCFQQGQALGSETSQLLLTARQRLSWCGHSTYWKFDGLPRYNHITIILAE